MSTPSTPPVLTVSALNRLARRSLEERFPLLWVAGEISNLTRAASGHLYFTLKDESAQVRCAMFRNRAQLLPWRLENGQQVEAQALVTLYEPRGDYQLNVEGLRRAGLGRLYEAFARLREQLEREGLFDAARKRALPRLPRRIGVVTSAQAAALRDILAALARRAPQVEVIIFPTLVQGEAAPAQIVAAIAAAGKAGLDVLIVARGGGSIEDLWAFNDEAVARAIAACPMPVVTGVGHETDTTIADFVADLRAATPTAAAELVSAGWLAARDEVAALADGLGLSLRRQLQTRMQRLDLLARRLIHPGERLARLRGKLELAATRLAAAVAKRAQQSHHRLADLRIRLGTARPEPAAAVARLALLRQRLGAALQQELASRRHAVAACAGALGHLSPEATLARGYAIVRDAQGDIVRSSRQIVPGGRIALRFGEGSAEAEILNKEP